MQGRRVKRKRGRRPAAIHIESAIAAAGIHDAIHHACTAAVDKFFAGVDGKPAGHVRFSL